MIGKICSSVIPYYDSKSGQNSYKRRPVLVIAGPRNNDFTVLPISTVSRKENLDNEYDIKIEPQKYPKLNLNNISYVRTHKQTTVHKASLVREIGNIKDEYEELYLLILEKLEHFNQEVMNNAL